MCGIYVTNISYSKLEVVNKLQSISFRGPDNLGYSVINKLSFGHVRLSVLDLETRSNQPFLIDGFQIVYNGEIYNFEDIKSELIMLGYQFKTKSDTEVLLIGYKEWGKNILSRLNGMFSFVIYDIEKNKLFCARDRVGVKPFYYYWNEGEFEICSQLKPIYNNSLQISSDAISIYLDCGYIPSPYSIFEKVFKLSPGHYLEIDLNTKIKNVVKYWDLKKVQPIDVSYSEAKNTVHELLNDAVKIRMRTDVPMGSFLSGGIDSALISSIASNYLDEPLKTFTIGFDDFNFDESAIAKQFSNIIGTEHKNSICKPSDVLNMLPDFVKVYDEPFADSSALPSLLLNSLTKQHVTVALSGDGGDESFLGYSYFPMIQKADFLMKIPYFIRKNLIANSGLNHLFGKDTKAFKAIFKSKDIDELIIKNFIGYDSIKIKEDNGWLRYYDSFKISSDDAVQKAADLNIKLWLENDSNVKVDRASMAHAVEVRSPFLDYRIMEYARSLPVNFRLKNGNQKRILKDILKNYIPEDIFERPKMGFSIPRASWIRNELKEDIKRKLNLDFLERVPNLDVKLFISIMNDHFEGVKDHSFAIWKLYILALWFEEYNLI